MTRLLPRLILASASPRRRQLLRSLGIPFQVRPSDVAEERRQGEPPRRRAARLAREKAVWRAARIRTPAWVLGADTLVVAGGSILEKPADAAEAARMLRRLGGRWHQVISAVHLCPAGGAPGAPLGGIRATRVRFQPLSPGWVDWLLAADEHADKAGAYAAQGRAGAVITDLRGPYTNVVGLPLDLTAGLLARLGYLPSGVSRRRPGRRGTRRRS